MAETLVNKTQAGEGLWHQDNLVAGSGISISQVPQPVIDENTVALYHFNDNAKDEISREDASGSYSLEYIPGKFGQASRFAGTTSSTINFSSTFTPSSFGSFTIDYWIKKTGSSKPYFTLRFYGTNDDFSIKYSDSSIILGKSLSGINQGLAFNYADFDFEYNILSWNQFVYEFDNENNCTYLFINGHKIMQNTLTVASIGTSNCQLHCTGGDLYYGAIDEFRFSNCVRWTSDFTPFTVPYAASAGSTQYAISNTLDISGKQDTLTTATGYDATKTQVLKNVNGTLTWVDEA